MKAESRSSSSASARGAHPNEGRCRYRYTGLRLLITRADRYSLLPAGWAGRTDATCVLKDGDDLRVELYEGTR